MIRFKNSVTFILLTTILRKGYAELQASWPPERIVGGVDIPEGSYVPYQVSLQYLMNPEGLQDSSGPIYKHFCGGSIISALHILTAAHCCYGFDANRMTVVAGVRDLRDPTAKRYPVENIRLHSNYTELFSNDIAIIKLSTRLDIDNHTQSVIDFKGGERIPGGVTVFLTGWGLRLPLNLQIPFSWPSLQEHLNTISTPTILQVMHFRTVSDFQCKLAIEHLTPRELCVTGDWISGACSGDSGGPLVMVTKNGLIQVGLVSYGLFVCGVFNGLVPDVYTRISEYTDWIEMDAYFDALDAVPDSQERVVGGYGVDSEQYINYQISLQYNKDGEYRHFCGGSIISPNRILTAAHCVQGQNAEKLSILAGINDLRAKDGTRSQVTAIDVHKNYVPLKSSDIAILNIDPPLSFDGKRIDKINFSNPEKVGAKQAVRLSGWGSVHHFGNGILARYPKRLQLLNYVTMANEDCKRTMSDLSDTEICARERFGKGACNGDSGGPLVMQKDDTLTQVGIVSYGTAFCASSAPDVYTRVTEFDDWIKERL
ncbi:transmembrane protease serine 9-like [Musca autumnalis]|uniref:transmembrane protease serine 9-like n=1 Tax=Musca autumnalis TaxID=221902 RepID=UPI003CF082B6